METVFVDGDCMKWRIFLLEIVLNVHIFFSGDCIK